MEVLMIRCSFLLIPALVTAAFAASAAAAPVTIVHSGSSTGINSGFGGTAGAGSSLAFETLLDGSVNITHTSGGGDLNDAVVMYIDTDSGATGFSSTSGFTDTDDGLRRAISGLDGAERSTLNFAPGFSANYAVAWSQWFGGLWNLVNDGEHGFVTSANLSPSGDGANLAGTWNLGINLADIGLAPGDSFRFVVTYISETAWRSNEFHGVAAFAGDNPGRPSEVTLSSGDFNTLISIPEPASLALLGLGGLVMLARRRAA
jgi:hypothetical protein